MGKVKSSSKKKLSRKAHRKAALVEWGSPDGGAGRAGRQALGWADDVGAPGS
jgi:hypothetical protein